MTDVLTGRVFLVGAGPGDPELLTVKAHNLIRNADVILHDDLVLDAILALADPQAEIVNVGKRCGAKSITQEEINRRMIAAARRGLSVVRLKIGDPAIFGRLAEEVDSLHAAGVSFEIVPGVTAGTAAAASLGVSLTDRRASARIVIVTGYHAHDIHSRKKIDWSTLAREDATLVVYMPGHEFAALREELLAAGLPPDIPAIIVSRATTAAQRAWISTLAELDAAPRLDSPTILLIGRSLARAGLEKSSADNSAIDSAIAFAAAEFPLRG